MITYDVGDVVIVNEKIMLITNKASEEIYLACELNSTYKTSVYISEMKTADNLPENCKLFHYIISKNSILSYRFGENK